MSAYKKYTQLAFNNPKDYGDLGILYELITQISDYRKLEMMTQKELADKSELAQSYIAKFESGRANPTALQLLKILRALDLKITLEKADLGPKPTDMN